MERKFKFEGWKLFDKRNFEFTLSKAYLYIVPTSPTRFYIHSNCAFTLLNDQKTEQCFMPCMFQFPANHHRVVRGIIGDTLNKAIDGLKSLWYKAKDKIGQIKVKNHMSLKSCYPVAVVSS